MNKFELLGAPPVLVEALTRMDITTPTPIQEKAIPPALAKKDIIGLAQTGTGKTIAFLVPVISHLLQSSANSAIILAPTRELAGQIKEVAAKLMGRKRRDDIALLIGGQSMGFQISCLDKSVRLIIGTPGRVIDHMNRGTLDLRHTNMLVLDEVDLMLDLGFREPLAKIIGSMPKERQTFMFSATMPPSISQLAKVYLTNPETISCGSSTQPTATVNQKVIETSRSAKYDILCQELSERTGSVLIFVKTKIGADRLAGKLKLADHEAVALHGDLRQNKRNAVMRSFRMQDNRILVATDIAARGLDIDHVMHVINFDLPQCPQDYVHRIGRTGRAGKEGNAVSFVTPEDKLLWAQTQRFIDPTKRDADKDVPAQQRRRSSYSGPRGGGYARGGEGRYGNSGGFERRRSGDQERSSEGRYGNGGGSDRRRSGDQEHGGFRRFGGNGPSSSTSSSSSRSKSWGGPRRDGGRPQGADASSGPRTHRSSSRSNGHND